MGTDLGTKRGKEDAVGQSWVEDNSIVVADI
jgi:hypothetical protein